MAHKETPKDVSMGAQSEEKIGVMVAADALVLGGASRKNSAVEVTLTTEQLKRIDNQYKTEDGKLDITTLQKNNALYVQFIKHIQTVLGTARGQKKAYAIVDRKLQYLKFGIPSGIGSQEEGVMQGLAEAGMFEGHDKAEENKQKMEYLLGHHCSNFVTQVMESFPTTQPTQSSSSIQAPSTETSNYATTALNNFMRYYVTEKTIQEMSYDDKRAMAEAVLHNFVFRAQAAKDPEKTSVYINQDPDYGAVRTLMGDNINLQHQTWTGNFDGKQDNPNLESLQGQFRTEMLQRIRQNSVHSVSLQKTVMEVERTVILIFGAAPQGNYCTSIGTMVLMHDQSCSPDNNSNNIEKRAKNFLDGIEEVKRRMVEKATELGLKAQYIYDINIGGSVFAPHSFKRSGQLTSYAANFITDANKQGEWSNMKKPTPSDIQGDIVKFVNKKEIANSIRAEVERKEEWAVEDKAVACECNLFGDCSFYSWFSCGGEGSRLGSTAGSEKQDFIDWLLSIRNKCLGSERGDGGFSR